MFSHSSPFRNRFPMLAVVVEMTLAVVSIGAVGYAILPLVGH
jgi:hypothetical protein